MGEAKIPAVLLIGAPGSGKGTQGRILDQQPGFCHVSSGDLFRSLDPDSPEGREVEQHASRGELVPDDLTIRVFGEAVRRLVRKRRFQLDREIFVLDGIPRNVQQAEILDGQIDVLRIVCLDSSNEDAMVERIKARALQENRADDADEQVIRHRFDVYRAETAPVLAHYPADLIFRVDALPPIEEVSQTILNELIPLRDQLLGGQKG